MTTDQMMSLAIIVLMMAAFIWGRFRYDLVACGCAARGRCGRHRAARQGVQRLQRRHRHHRRQRTAGQRRRRPLGHHGIRHPALRAGAFPASAPQLVLLVVIVTVLSAFVKNIGALAIMIPIAFQFARRSNTSPSVFLMPMAFASLLGGLMTQIGTSPNIVVSRVRQELTGEAFTMFDFTPVGAVAGRGRRRVPGRCSTGCCRSGRAHRRRSTRRSTSRTTSPRPMSLPTRRSSARRWPICSSSAAARPS